VIRTGEGAVEAVVTPPAVAAVTDVMLTSADRRR
jgi:hypothetical protein